MPRKTIDLKRKRPAADDPAGRHPAKLHDAAAKPEPEFLEFRNTADIRRSLKTGFMRQFVDKWNLEYRVNRLAEAYSRAEQWRKADVEKLLKIGVNEDSQQRIRKLLREKSSGRGVVRKYYKYEILLRAKLRAIDRLHNPTTPWAEKLALAKNMWWWPFKVEAAYRGELTIATEERAANGVAEYGHEAPAKVAEGLVAHALGISPAQVHKLCVFARGVLKERPDIRALSARRAEDLRTALETGRSPEVDEMDELPEVDDFE